MYIAGIGRTKFGILEKSLPELLYEAMKKAIEDSPINIKEISTIAIANYLGGVSQSQLHLGSLVSSLLPGTNLPAFRVEAACASGGVAVYKALNFSGKSENMLIVGGEKQTSAPNRIIIKNIAMAGDLQRDQQEGLLFPAQYAIVAAQYLRKYNASHEALSLVSIKNYKNARLNPLAHFNYKDLTPEEINSSQMICTPLRLYDCCPVSDGAAAIVLSKTNKSDRDVRIAGFGCNCDAISLSQRREFTTFKAVRLAAKTAYNMAKIGPKDVDIAEVHDCFTIAEMVAMEDLGFCERGRAAELLRNDETSISGRIPINTDGGLIGDGHPVGATGIAQICEIVQQIREEAGNRQVSNARIGLAHNVGGVGGTAAVHILERLK